MLLCVTFGCWKTKPSLDHRDDGQQNPKQVCHADKSRSTLNNNHTMCTFILHSCEAAHRMVHGIREAVHASVVRFTVPSPSLIKDLAFVFSEQERAFKLTCAARHRAQTLRHRETKMENSGISEITNPGLRRPTAFKKLADSC